MVVAFGGFVAGVVVVAAAFFSEPTTSQVVAYLWVIVPGLGIGIGARIGYRAPYGAVSRLGVAFAWGGVPLVGGVAFMVGGDIGEGSEAVSGIGALPVLVFIGIASPIAFLVGLLTAGRDGS